MASHKSFNYQHVMSRMEWFRDLKLIFNKLLSEEDVLTPVDRNLLLKELNIRSSKFDLKSPEEYFTRSKVQAFSLAEILKHIESLDSAVNFDQLIDSLIYLSMNKKKREKLVEETKREEPKQEKTEKGLMARVGIISDESLTPSFKESNRVTVFVAQNPVIRLKSTNNIRPVTPIKDPVLDLNYPDEPLYVYPELNAYEKLMYLYLAGNLLSDTNFHFPKTLIGLNLSCNQLSELNFIHELPALSILNATNNQISKIFSVNQIKHIKEIYISNNCISSLNLFCHLTELLLLDTSNNEIESFEDIAGLVISKRLGILKLKGNPLSSKDNYEKIVQNILPRIYNFDPPNMINFSTFKSLGPSIFAPLKSLQEVSEKSLPKNNSALISNKSEKKLTPKPKTESSPISVQKSQKYIVSKTPAIGQKPGTMRRSNSQLRIDKSKALISTTKTMINLNENDDFVDSEIEVIDKPNMIDLAERRIKVFKEEMKGKHNVSVVSNETIQNVKKKVYGNPVAAMMIGPPAVGQGRIRAAKTPCLSLDLSRGKRK